MDIPYASPTLYFEGLAPIVDRKLGASSICNVRTSDLHHPWSDCLAASVFPLCGGFLNFIVALGTVVAFSSILPSFSDVLPPWWGMVGRFFGLAIAGAVYFVLATIVPRPAPQNA